MNQPEARPPANAVAPGGEEAGPSRIVPYPYDRDEMIGGNSVRSIQSRLLYSNPLPSAHEIEMARIQAEDLFEVKAEIIKLMAGLDPTGDWMGWGARALDNPRTATGEQSLERLFALLGDLERNGIKSEAFSQLKERVPLRRSGGDEHSTT